MKLYYTPDTCALAPLVTLCEAGAEFDLEIVDFSNNDQKSPAYTAMNPKARVPTLMVGDTALTETPAILAYVAATYPQAGLMPSDPLEFARVQSFNSYLCSTLHVAHAHRMRGERWADSPEAIKAMQAKVPESVGACYDYIENHAFEGPFVFGAFSTADPYLYTVARWMEGDSLDMTRYPKIVAHRERMADRPAVQKALGFNP